MARHAVTAAAVLGVIVPLATACSSGGATTAKGGQPSASYGPQVSGPPADGKCPLTDTDPTAGASATSPILAVKVDGSLSGEPQAGLDAADVVYDEPVEGGIAWYLALYQCTAPARVGPVRESRMVDPDILQPFGSALLATAGGPKPVADHIKATPGIVSLDSLTQGTAFARDSTRVAPHNLFADPAKLRAAGSATPLVPLSAPRAVFAFSTSPQPSSAAKARSVTFTLGPQVSYQYDAGTNAYLRSENGRPHRSASGAQIAVTNVVIVWVQIDQSQIIDPAGNTSPTPVLLGEGNAMILTEGTEHDGTWKRANASSPLTFLDGDGAPIPLAPGNTWIHLVPADRSASVQ